MVHHVVEFVAVAVLLISKVDGGGGAVLPIDVVTDPHELSEEVVLAVPSVPPLVMRAVVECFRNTRGVSDDLELRFTAFWLCNPCEFSLIKVVEIVRRSSAREANAIILVVPSFWWIPDVSHRIGCHVVESNISIVLDWNVI